MDPSRPYFSRRAREERANAQEASSTEARKAHLELAFRYEKVAAQLYVGHCSSADRTPRTRRAPAADRRAEIGRAISSAFPLPTSGAFPDLLEAIDDAERRMMATEN